MGKGGCHAIHLWVKPFFGLSDLSQVGIKPERPFRRHKNPLYLSSGPGQNVHEKSLLAGSAGQDFSQLVRKGPGQDS